MNLFTTNRAIVIGADFLLMVLSFYASYLLRFEQISPTNMAQLNMLIWPVLTVKIAAYSMFGLHTGPWRYTGIMDLANLIKSSLISLLIIGGGLAFTKPELGFSRSVLLIDFILTIIFTGSFRIAIRLTYSQQTLKKLLGIAFTDSVFGKRGAKNSQSILIYGANERGEALIRSIISRQGKASTTTNIVGLIDDNPNLKGTSIHGYKWRGCMNDLEELIDRYDITELMLASTPKDKEALTKAYQICREKKVVCRIIPNYLDVVNQRDGATHLKDIAIEDLLGREPVKIDYSNVASMINGKRVMVTGAAGSIGSQLCRQILEFSPLELLCIDIGETPLFFLCEQLKENFPNISIRYYCSNVTNLEKMDTIFKTHKPHKVFHAAALKHVPLMEANKDEAMFVNLRGTMNIASLAKKYDAEKFTFISTDKAVNPANVMGWTKRAGELYVASLAMNGNTSFISVRFGNVLGSNGSVIPIFTRQIAKGGPITITDKNVTRYFMTIPEAVLLILQSTLIASSGDTMILDMGQPIKITELAEDMIRLAGHTPDEDIKITFTGLRPGEKMHEELSTDLEELQETSHRKINCLRGKYMGLERVPSILTTTLKECAKEPEKGYNTLRDGLSTITNVADSKTSHLRQVK